MLSPPAAGVALLGVASVVLLDVLLAVYASLLVVARGAPSGCATSGSATLYLELPSSLIVMCAQRSVPELTLSLNNPSLTSLVFLVPDVVFSVPSSQFLACLIVALVCYACFSTSRA